MIRILLLGFSFIISLGLGLLIIPNILLVSHKKRLYDMPGGRKVHNSIVPQLGGVAFYPSILMSLCVVLCMGCKLGVMPADPLFTNTTTELLLMAVGCMLLYLTGIVDDLIGVRYSYKFAVQLVAAALLMFSGDWFNHLGGFLGIGAIPDFIGIPLSLLFIVYTINAVNLIDGIDGLASGLCSISLSVISVMLIILHHDVYACLSLATLGVIIPFWFFNVFGNARKGHKLFMGDTGSLVLGYILSFLVLRLSIHVPIDEYHPRQLVLSVSTLMIPLLDVVRVVVFRIRHGKNPFLPDKNHFHHKLLRTGMNVFSVLAFILCSCLFFLFFNYIVVSYVSVTALFVIDISLWITMHIVIDFFIHKPGMIQLSVQNLLYLCHIKSRV